MDETIVSVIRSIIAFATLLIFTRVLGKQQVGQLTAFEYVAGITIGSAASSLSIDLSIKPFPQWVALATWVLLVWGLQKVSIKHRWIAKVMDDQPTIVVQNGKILEQNLKKIAIVMMSSYLNFEIKMFLTLPKLLLLYSNRMVIYRF